MHAHPSSRPGDCEQCLAAAVFDNTMEGIAITDMAGTILAVNPAFTAITGYGKIEALGQNMRLLKSDRHKKSFYEAIWHSLRTHGHWQGEIWNRRKNGELFPEWTTISSVRGDDGATANYVSVFTDISPIKDAEARLEFLAHHDVLTGLPNRTMLLSRMDQAMKRARRANRFCALIFLDLDHFKTVNDRLGHRAGDELLRQVAERITGRLRNSDTLARMGGDEFVAVLEDLPQPGSAAQVVRGVIELLNRPFLLCGESEVCISASAGISIFPDHGEDAETLLDCADTALYRVKEEGRNGFHFHAPAEE